MLRSYLPLLLPWEELTFLFLFSVDVTDDPNAGGRVKTEGRIESRPTRWLLDIAVIIALLFFLKFFK